MPGTLARSWSQLRSDEWQDPADMVRRRIDELRRKPIEELKVLYGAETGELVTERMSQSDMQAFTYWLSKYRVRTVEPAAVIRGQYRGYREEDGVPVVFYPEPNATQKFELLVAGGEGNTTIPNGAVFVEFRPMVYLSFFYNRQARDAFTALPDE